MSTAVPRKRRGLFRWPIAMLWRLVTPVSNRIGIVPSLGGGLVLMLVGFILPAIVHGSIALSLLGYLLGAFVFVFGVALFIRGVI
ncbi:MAG: hypothetical protein FJY92_00480 [Candidatus Hydrogenedentes bacterium]|nr:hypothetical protein [Candidatus Hydrogenedentota bacterium]